MKRLFLSLLVQLSLTLSCGATSTKETGGNTSWLIQCSQDSECAAGQVCAAGLCAQPCEAADDCAGNLRCDTAPAARGASCGSDVGRAVCSIPCDSNDDCGANLICDGKWCNPAPDLCGPGANVGEFDSGVPPSPDMGESLRSDSGTSSGSDSGTSSSSDAGEPLSSDSGMPSSNDSSVPIGSDSGESPSRDSGEPPSTDSGMAPSNDCATCLRAGGTWQPEAKECTNNCAYQDISCFRDKCPESCNADTCSCFSEATCHAVGCEWRQEAEAAWCVAMPVADAGTSDCESCLKTGGTWQPEANECTDNCALQDISCFRDMCP